jgi:uncharacterized protein YjlB
VEDGDRIDLDAGDVVIFPHGDAHIIENGRPTMTVDLSSQPAGINIDRQRSAGSGLLWQLTEQIASNG